jgi:hypothetical protein
MLALHAVVLASMSSPKLSSKGERFRCLARYLAAVPQQAIGEAVSRGIEAHQPIVAAPRAIVRALLGLEVDRIVADLRWLESCVDSELRGEGGGDRGWEATWLRSARRQREIGVLNRKAAVQPWISPA